MERNNVSRLKKGNCLSGLISKQFLQKNNQNCGFFVFSLGPIYIKKEFLFVVFLFFFMECCMPLLISNIFQNNTFP